MPQEYKRIIGAALGIAAALLIIFLGFWRGILVVALGLAGWWLTGPRACPRWIGALAEWLKRQKPNKFI